MKKIFAISVLSLLAVVGADNAFALPYKEPFYTAARIEQEIGQATAGMLTNKNIISSNETTTRPDYDAPSVSRMENTVNAAVATKVDNTQVVQKNATVTSADSQIPTIARMEDYVDSEISAKVGTSQVITSSGTDLGGNQVADSVSSDAVVPTLKTVEENFVPSEAEEYKDDYHYIEGRQPGLYTIMVEIDENGNEKFIWQAVQRGIGETSVGGVAG